MLSRLEDPRAVTVIVAALLSAALWVATWSTMGSMDMAAMGGMGGMEGMGGGMGSGMGAGMGSGMGSGENAGAGMGRGMAPAWSPRLVFETSAMWILMMAAMMLPSMAPVMSVYAGVARREDQGLRLAARITLFALGYFALWAVASVALAGLQLWWRSSSWFEMGGTQATPAAAGLLLLAAGLYQFTPLKHACLRHCRHPLQFLLAHWRPGFWGALPIGLHHGAYCVGCCIVFMGLMFVFGAMNVWWMAAIAVYFLAEKVLPKAEIWSLAVGAALCVAGVWTLTAAL